jgi:hypothetical protein
VVVMMPIPATRPEVLHHMLDIVIETLEQQRGRSPVTPPPPPPPAEG